MRQICYIFDRKEPPGHAGRNAAIPLVCMDEPIGEDALNYYSTWFTNTGADQLHTPFGEPLGA